MAHDGLHQARYRAPGPKNRDLLFVLKSDTLDELHVGVHGESAMETWLAIGRPPIAICRPRVVFTMNGKACHPQIGDFSEKLAQTEWQKWDFI